MMLMSMAFAQTDSSSRSYESKQEVVVTAIRGGNRAPVTQYTLTRRQVEERYYGADIPTLLNFTPSVNTYSDNGTGIGYSSFRLRGMDLTRINFTVNGVPVNDPEGQGVFFNNFADLATSAENIQVQRGVGTSTNGTSAFGGSVSLLTRNLSATPEFALHAGMGSFGSRRVSAEYQTGMIKEHFAFYGRMSEVGTNGYRDRSGAVIRSYMLSAGYFGKKSVLKLNAFGGFAESQLAYSGIDKATLDANRKANPFTNNERDAFHQQFFQAQYTYNLSKNSEVVASAYYVTGGAPRFEVALFSTPAFAYSYSSFNMPDAIVNTDTLTSSDFIGSYRLQQEYYGGFVNYHTRRDRLELNAGLHASAFSSDHFMEVTWARNLPAGIAPYHRAYLNTGYKNEASAFIKLSYNLSDALSVFADAQLRMAAFRYRATQMDIRKDTFKVDDMSWTFFNPKLGLRYAVNNRVAVYAMAGRTSREPTRTDYFQDDFATRDTKQGDIKYETVNDLEIGTQVKSDKLSLNANVFFMEFENQIASTGQLNVYGYYITTNVKSSYRRGAELDFLWKINKFVWLMNSTAFSRNRVKEVAQHYSLPDFSDTAIVYSNTSLALSPEWIVNQGVRIIPLPWLYVEGSYRYVSMQYLDNAQDAALSLPSFSIVDARVGIDLSRFIRNGSPSLSIQCNNLLDAKYTPSGSVQPYTNNISYDANGNAVNGSTPSYFPAATRNFFVTLNLRF